MLSRMQMRAKATAALIVTLVLRAAAALPLVRLCMSSAFPSLITYRCCPDALHVVWQTSSVKPRFHVGCHSTWAFTGAAARR